MCLGTCRASPAQGMYSLSICVTSPRTAQPEPLSFSHSTGKHWPAAGAQSHSWEQCLLAGWGAKPCLTSDEVHIFWVAGGCGSG